MPILYWDLSFDDFSLIYIPGVLYLSRSSYFSRTFGFISVQAVVQDVQLTENNQPLGPAPVALQCIRQDSLQ